MGHGNGLKHIIFYVLSYLAALEERQVGGKTVVPGRVLWSGRFWSAGSVVRPSVSTSRHSCLFGVVGNPRGVTRDSVIRVFYQCFITKGRAG